MTVSVTAEIPELELYKALNLENRSNVSVGFTYTEFTSLDAATLEALGQTYLTVLLNRADSSEPLGSRLRKWAVAQIPTIQTAVDLLP